jgi:hypothetical protein
MRLLLVKRAKKKPKRKMVVRVKRAAKVIKLMMNQRTSQKLVLAK